MYSKSTNKPSIDAVTSLYNHPDSALIPLGGWRFHHLTLVCGSVLKNVCPITPELLLNIKKQQKLNISSYGNIFSF